MAALAHMTTSNKRAAEILQQHEVHAATDVTGFGLLVRVCVVVDLAHGAVMGVGHLLLGHLRDCRATRFGGSVTAGRSDMGLDFSFELLAPLQQAIAQGAHPAGMAGFGLVHAASPQRTTSTGTLEWVSTFWVSLPSRKPDRPRRPCDDITIRSHLSFAAVLTMAS